MTWPAGDRVRKTRADGRTNRCLVQRITVRSSPRLLLRTHAWRWNRAADKNLYQVAVQ